MTHPSKVGQLVRFIPDHNNESCPDDAIFKVVHYYVDLGEAFVRIIPVSKSSRGYGISRHTNRYATRFQVVSQRISYTKDIHGTIHNRPTLRPISSNERDRTSEPLSPRRISMDSFADGFVSRESTPLRELSIDSISPTSRLREATSQDSRPTIRQDFFQWARGLVNNVSNRRTEIPRPNHAAEARRLEGNQSARYQRVTQLPDIPYLQMFRKADQAGRLYFEERGPLWDYPERRFATPTTSPTHTVTFLVGLPCSRKSTYAKNLTSGAILSRDDLLTYTYPDMTYNEAYEYVRSDSARLQIFNKAFDKLITQRSREQKDLVVDMTNLSLKSRRSLMQRFPHAQFKCVVFLPPFSSVIRCNQTRPGKSISTDILINMSKSFVMPVKQEGFTDITYILE